MTAVPAKQSGPDGFRGRPTRRTTASGPDAGAAVVEFVMISVLLVLLLFCVVQIAAVFYVRNIVAASAADGARYASAAGVDAQAGGPRAGRLIADGLSAAISAGVPCASGPDVDAASGLRVTRVECTGRIRSLLIPLGAFVDIHVVARSVEEP